VILSYCFHSVREIHGAKFNSQIVESTRNSHMNPPSGSNFGSFGGSTTSTPGGFNQQQNSQRQQQPQDDGVSRWCKMATRAAGTVAGILSLALGLFACITFHASCLAAGLIQMLLGFLLVTFEAPCCCMFLDFIERISNFSETRPYWQKALLYGLISPIPIILCLEVSTFFGAGLIFITGVMYGMMALGKKADRSEIMARAAAPSNTTSGTGTGGGGVFNFGFTGRSDSMQTNLVDRDKQPTVLAA